MTRLRSPQTVNQHRRRLLRQALVASGVLAVGPGLWGMTTQGSPRSAMPLSMGKKVSNIPNLSGTLHEVAVENDASTRMLVPRGFSVRQVARTGERPVAVSDYLWHADPDGGACFPMDDGGWVYVSNAEVGAWRQGGVGALRFNAEGELVDSYSICRGTTNNCAGGPTPWGTWLTCEEIDEGLVYECDPTGRRLAVPAPALGVFKHEAAAVDPVHRHIYLTEDVEDGNFYRFVPDSYPPGGRADLRSGRLEVAVVSGDDPLTTRLVEWRPVPNPIPRLGGDDPARRDPPTRKQVPEAETFDGGEGCWYFDGIVYFTTKGDNRVWALDTNRNMLDLVYDKQSDQAFNPGIDDVDNLTVSAGGDVLVAEDGSEMRLVVVGPDVKPFELVNVMGQHGSEICGPAFSPDGERLYFSSQNGPAGDHTDGRIYELRGPFFVDA
ncbi:alkaline phosphatase PhoX [Wenzhouxiangella sp. EGI_FJ10409]|uniref:alkaline phosphatase PhoX n=1 Tax=Wenzhouxiangella sp. EGI_FJ10409 TaxID=3243767 RepID=UPI0035D9E4C4